jgi:hypothetical protein
MHYQEEEIIYIINLLFDQHIYVEHTRLIIYKYRRRFNIYDGMFFSFF